MSNPPSAITLRRLAIVVVSLMLTAWLGALSPTHANSDSLKSSLARIASDQKLGSSADVGIAVFDLDSQRWVFSKNDQEALIPASNQKVLTTACAWDLLGPEFQIHTDLRYRGQIKGSVLDGDLLLIGRGDPNISGRHFGGDVTRILREFAAKVREHGVTEITGALYFDDSYFTGTSTHSGWPDDQYLRWYCAEVSALSINDNCATISVEATRSGQSAKVSFLPTTSLVSIEGAIDSRSGKSDPKVGWSRARADNQIKVWGEVFSGRPAYVGDCTIHDPAAIFADSLKHELEETGIALNGAAVRAKPAGLDGWPLMARWSSDLPVTVNVCNEASQNLYAECLLRILGKERAGEGSFEAGSGVVRKWLQERDLAGEGLVIEDGSGLSRGNRVSARTLVGVLNAMHKHPKGGLYKATMAVNGMTGTLDKRLRGSATTGRLRGKTGTIRSVSTLSGYITGASGREYAFAILVNNYRGSARTYADALVKDVLTKG